MKAPEERKIIKTKEFSKIPLKKPQAERAFGRDISNFGNKVIVFLIIECRKSVITKPKKPRSQF
jgi:hypothetical protein